MTELINQQALKEYILKLGRANVETTNTNVETSRGVHVFLGLGLPL